MRALQLLNICTDFSINESLTGNSVSTLQLVWIYQDDLAPDRTATSCQEQGMHILRGFSMEQP